MPLAALILAYIDEEGDAASQPLLLTLGGQTLLERLSYQALRVGCSHIILCAGPLPAPLLAAIDRLKARGVDISLSRDPREAADRLHPDEQVLVFGKALVLPDADVSALAQAGEASLLTLPEAWGRDRFERIDAEHNWAGLARLPARLIRDTVAMLGDWSFGPTLLRRVVQHGVTRQPLMLEAEQETDAVAPLVRDDLRGAARAMSKAMTLRCDGVVESGLFALLVRPLASWIALKPVSATMLACLTLLLAVAALGLAAVDQVMAGLLVLALASGAALLTEAVGQAGIPEPKPIARLLQGRVLWLPLLLILAGGLGLALNRLDILPALLCLWCAVHLLQSAHLESRAALLPSWRPGNAGLALLIALGIGLGHPVVGLGLALLALWVALGVAQHKIRPN